MAVSAKGKCLISLPKSGEAVFFDPERGLQRKPVICLDPQKQVVGLALQEMFAIVLYEQSVAIFNA